MAENARPHTFGVRMDDSEKEELEKIQRHLRRTKPEHSWSAAQTLRHIVSKYAATVKEQA
jgi:hypothetical protein